MGEAIGRSDHRAGSVTPQDEFFTEESDGEWATHVGHTGHRVPRTPKSGTVAQDGHEWSDYQTKSFGSGGLGQHDPSDRFSMGVLKKVRGISEFMPRRMGDERVPSASPVACENLIGEPPHEVDRKVGGVDRLEVLRLLVGIASTMVVHRDAQRELSRSGDSCFAEADERSVVSALHCAGVR